VLAEMRALPVEPAALAKWLGGNARRVLGLAPG